MTCANNQMEVLAPKCPTCKTRMVMGRDSQGGYTAACKGCGLTAEAGDLLAPIEVFEWTHNGETTHWNVTAMRKFLMEYDPERQYVKEMPHEFLKGMLEANARDAPPAGKRGVTPADEPLIFVGTPEVGEDGEDMLTVVCVNGWHRARVAVEAGHSLMAWILPDMQEFHIDV